MASGISASSIGTLGGFGGGLGHQGDLQSSVPAQLFSALSGGHGGGLGAGCCGREQYSSNARSSKDGAFAAAGQGLADFLA